MTTLCAEWRTSALRDAVLVVDDAHTVRAAIVVDEVVLRRFLTDLGDLGTWRGAMLPEGIELLPEAWGERVMTRASTGEVLEMDPEAFWDGIYRWYRSRGVDYDSVPVVPSGGDVARA